MALESFLDKESQLRVVEAIGVAEKCTSGEIRVHIEPTCKKENPYDRAVEVFDQLEMYKTEARNGVLIYIAYKSRKLAVIGDKGITQKVGVNFWVGEKDILAEYLRAKKPAEGLCKVIKMIGENLAKYFPYQNDDVNELSNEISYEE
ncbi:MAG: TPM domain-containing protein [Bacteroidales bacterium]|nr:TPM domain-containing protein [Bacteroidales bacterium]